MNVISPENRLGYKQTDNQEGEGASVEKTPKPLTPGEEAAAAESQINLLGEQADITGKSIEGDGSLQEEEVEEVKDFRAMLKRAGESVRAALKSFFSRQETATPAEPQKEYQETKAAQEAAEAFFQAGQSETGESVDYSRYDRESLNNIYESAKQAMNDLARRENRPDIDINLPHEVELNLNSEEQAKLEMLKKQFDDVSMEIGRRNTVNRPDTTSSPHEEAFYRNQQENLKTVESEREQVLADIQKELGLSREDMRTLYAGGPEAEALMTSMETQPTSLTFGTGDKLKKMERKMELFSKLRTMDGMRANVKNERFQAPTIREGQPLKLSVEGKTVKAKIGEMFDDGTISIVDEEGKPMQIDGQDRVPIASILPKEDFNAAVNAQQFEIPDTQSQKKEDVQAEEPAWNPGKFFSNIDMDAVTGAIKEGRNTSNSEAVEQATPPKPAFAEGHPDFPPYPPQDEEVPEETKWQAQSIRDKFKENGNLDEALKSSQEITDETDRHIAIRYIIEEVVASGDVDKALEIARTKDEKRAQRNIGTIAVLCAMRGNEKKALRIIESITDKNEREHALRIIENNKKYEEYRNTVEVTTILQSVRVRNELMDSIHESNADLRAQVEASFAQFHQKIDKHLEGKKELDSGELIKKRAYEMWEQAGRPENESQEVQDARYLEAQKQLTDWFRAEGRALTVSLNKIYPLAAKMEDVKKQRVSEQNKATPDDNQLKAYGQRENELASQVVETLNAKNINAETHNISFALSEAKNTKPEALQERPVMEASAEVKPVTEAGTETVDTGVPEPEKDQSLDDDGSDGGGMTPEQVQAADKEPTKRFTSPVARNTGAERKDDIGTEAEPAVVMGMEEELTADIRNKEIKNALLSELPLMPQNAKKGLPKEKLGSYIFKMNEKGELGLFTFDRPDAETPVASLSKQWSARILEKAKNINPDSIPRYRSKGEEEADMAAK
ncbi:MAG: DUF2934 domain-containing protein [Patescibacteria group bacterium]|jgi:hypothetical protein